MVVEGANGPNGSKLTEPTGCDLPLLFPEPIVPPKCLMVFPSQTLITLGTYEELKSMFKGVGGNENCGPVLFQLRAANGMVPADAGFVAPSSQP